MLCFLYGPGEPGRYVAKTMELDSQEVFDVFQAKEIASVFHANTVLTSTQFLRENALLSRGTIARHDNWYQTDQYSDPDDKSEGVWFDLFVDTFDIHKTLRRRNSYGPVLFVLDLEAVRTACTGQIWVTKLNPTKWDGKSHEEKWFTSIDELNENFSATNWDHMVVFRNCGGELPFDDCLQQIILDDPQFQNADGIDYYSMALGALTHSKFEGAVAMDITKRDCSFGCQCIQNYAGKRATTKKMFVPELE